MKTANIQIKIEPELKEKFLAWCEENAINPSQWIRKKITEAVAEQEEK